jgi:hypothetical protein
MPFVTTISDLVSMEWVNSGMAVMQKVKNLVSHSKNAGFLGYVWTWKEELCNLQLMESILVLPLKIKR